MGNNTRMSGRNYREFSSELMVDEVGEDEVKVRLVSMEVEIRELCHTISIRIEINDSEGKGRNGRIT